VQRNLVVIILAFSILNFFYFKAVIYASTETQITSSDFTYLGAFKVPYGTIGDSRFGWGGNQLAFRSNGDPGGDTDGFPGSLFMVGHAQHQKVAEFSIPKPVISPTKNGAHLNTAVVIQGFTDITGGLLAAQGWGSSARIGGFAYLEAQSEQTSSKLHWTIYRYYNVSNYSDLSHGWSEANLSVPNAKGVWRLGDYHSLRTAGYVFSAPQAWAESHLSGKRMISGMGYEHKAATSYGPALYAYTPWKHPQQPPTHEAKLDALQLLSYSNDHPLPGYKFGPDLWQAAAWVKAGERQAVIIAGRIALGDIYYGVGREGDCNASKGYHGDPYEPQILFYDPDDLAASARGEMESWEVLPYLRWNPQQYLYPDCNWYLSGAAFDAESGLLYITQQAGDRVTSKYEPYPLIHVFKIEVPAVPKSPTGLIVK